MQRKKTYVSVVAEFRPDGVILPQRIRWEDGRNFIVDRVEEIRPAASTKAGGYGLRYRCIVEGQRTCLYLEDGTAWFVEKKEYL